jgi:hypothetical protein
VWTLTTSGLLQQIQQKFIMSFKLLQNVSYTLNLYLHQIKMWKKHIIYTLQCKTTMLYVLYLVHVRITKAGSICKLQKCTTHVHSFDNEIHMLKLLHICTLPNTHMFILANKRISSNLMTCNTILITFNVGNSNMHDTMRALKTLAHVSKTSMLPNH